MVDRPSVCPRVFCPAVFAWLCSGCGGAELRRGEAEPQHLGAGLRWGWGRPCSSSADIYRLESLDGLALLPYLGGICSAPRRMAGPGVGVAFDRVPRVHGPAALAGGKRSRDRRLQSLATTASTYLLQTLGFMAFAEGNVIQLNEARIGVVEACSGLSMLITFIALSTAAALVVKRPLLDRIVLVASSVPVALLANIAPNRPDGHPA